MSRNVKFSPKTFNYLKQTTVEGPFKFKSIVTRIRMENIRGLYINPIQNGGRLHLTSRSNLFLTVYHFGLAWCHTFTLYSV